MHEPLVDPWRRPAAQPAVAEPHPELEGPLHLEPLRESDPSHPWESGALTSEYEPMPEDPWPAYSPYDVWGGIRRELTPEPRNPRGLPVKTPPANKNASLLHKSEPQVSVNFAIGAIAKHLGLLSLQVGRLEKAYASTAPTLASTLRDVARQNAAANERMLVEVIGHMRVMGGMRCPACRRGMADAESPIEGWGAVPEGAASSGWSSDGATTPDTQGEAERPAGPV
jgi:hypothetical protein